MADHTERTAEILQGVSSLNKADLLTRCREIAAQLAGLEASAGSDAPTQANGLIPVAYYVGGAEHRGTLVEIHRCTPRGESGDQWVVRHGVKMYTKEGHPMPYRRWSKLTPALRARTSMPFDQALRFARSLLK